MKTKKIKNKIDLFLNKKITIFGIIIILISFWIVGSVFFNNKFSYSVLNYGYNNQLNQDVTLYKGEKITGEFVSNDNFLGIVFIKFNDFVKPDYTGEDVLQFRIKEKGENDWYYLNNYRSGLLKDNLRFPFGFPVIRDSKEKTYLFEVESLFGNKNNAVNLNKSKTYISSGHQYSKMEIFGSKKRIINFNFKKFYNSFTDIEFIFSSIIFALPLILYIMWIVFLRKWNALSRALIFLVTALLIIDLIFIKSFYIGIYLGILTGWIISIKLNRLESSVSFLLGFLAIFMWIIFTYLKIDAYSEKLNIWSYTFLFIGTMQALVEAKYNVKNLEDYKSFIKRFNIFNE